MTEKMQVLQALSRTADANMWDISESLAVLPGRVFAALQALIREGMVTSDRPADDLRYALTDAGRDTVVSWEPALRREEASRA
jgi:DNA-binding MarR family transcriptional regulator